MTNAVATPAELILDIIRKNGSIFHDGFRWHGMTIGQTDSMIEHCQTLAKLVDEGEVICISTKQGKRFVPAAKVGMGVTEHGWSEAYPYEVVAVSPSGKTATIRPMNAELDPSWKPEMIAGGFAAHCVNQGDQKWILTSNPEAGTTTIRLTKNGWRRGDTRFSMGKARKFYDYNF